MKITPLRKLMNLFIKTTQIRILTTLLKIKLYLESRKTKRVLKRNRKLKKIQRMNEEIVK